MHGACVLIAEDDEDIREAMAEVVRDAGYEVEVAENGEAALAAMRAHQPCLLLLDLMMPKVDGWQVMFEMERDASLATVPVCVVSAVPKSAPPAAVCVMGKPVNLTLLLSTIDRHCGAHAKRG